MNFGKPKFSAVFGARGFLFTISVILFASTLVFYSQAYANLNFSSERSVLNSAKPVNALLLNDDIAFDVLKIMDVSIDANDFYSSQAFVSGSISPAQNISSDLAAYSVFLRQDFFPRLAGEKSVDFGGLEGGAGRIFFSDAAEFDYNYGNGLYFFPLAGAQPQEIDLNIVSSGDLNSYGWSKSAASGTMKVVINYFDGNNSFTITENDVDVQSLSSLNLVYSDGNSLVSIGRVLVGGDYKDSSFSFVPDKTQKTAYSIAVSYPQGVVLMPARIDAWLSYKNDFVDSNSLLAARR